MGSLVRERLTTLAWRLHNDEDTNKMIENIRVVCDLKSVLSNIKEKGSVVFGLQNSAKFLNAVRCITDSVRTISDEDIVKMYRNFLKKWKCILANHHKNFQQRDN